MITLEQLMQQTNNINKVTALIKCITDSIPDDAEVQDVLDALLTMIGRTVIARAIINNKPIDNDFRCLMHDVLDATINHCITVVKANREHSHE